MRRSVEHRDVVAVILAGEPHPAVVLKVRGDEAVILISGTSKSYPELRAIRFESGRPSAKSMGLTRTTYFYGTGVKVYQLADLHVWKDGHRKCPPQDAGELLAFAKEWLEQREQRLSERPEDAQSNA